MEVELTWLFLDLNSLEETPPVKFKSLIDICSEKLVSDVCLLRSCTRTPKVIYCRLLSTAFDQSRILSVSHLMKYSPFEEFKLPVSLALERWRSIDEMRQSVHENFKKFLDNAQILLNTFLRLINENCLTSQIQSVDFDSFAGHTNLLSAVHEFLANIKSKNRLPFPKSYTLKSIFILNSPQSVECLKQSIEMAKLTGFQLVITGVVISGNKFKENELLDILRKIEPSEFVHFTMRFSSIVPSIGKTLKQLWRFKNLKHLNCSFMSCNFSANTPLIEIFGKTLAELPCITHLFLRSNKLSGVLAMLLQHSCKKKAINSKKLKTEYMHCCIVHDGLLEYLDISACELTDEDILFLREFQSTATLKYLNLGCNTLNESAFETLLTLNSSLIVLDIESCFRMEYNPDLFPLSSFQKLKLLNMTRWPLTPRSEKLLTDELEKIPNVRVFRDAVRIPEEDFGDF